MADIGAGEESEDGAARWLLVVTVTSGEGECFAVEGGTEGVKVPVEDCGVSGRIDDGGLTMKRDRRWCQRRLVALTTLEVSRSSTSKVPESVRVMPV